MREQQSSQGGQNQPTRKSPSFRVPMPYIVAVLLAFISSVVFDYSFLLSLLGFGFAAGFWELFRGNMTRKHRKIFLAAVVIIMVIVILWFAYIVYGMFSGQMTLY